MILRALDYERTVSIESAGDRLVVRAALPLADPALRLLGALVVSVPVDGLVADRLKAALGAGREVIVYRNGEPSTSTFMAATGARLVGPRVPPEVSEEEPRQRDAGLRARGRRATPTRSPSAQLQDVNAQRVGLLGVAVDREPLAAARRRASTTLVLGALLALLLAIGLANLLARRMTRPLQDLHAGALSIARGDLDTKITVDSDDEIGDVAEAFRVMTRSLKENQEGLAARVRELVTVHQVGRAVSSVVDLDQVLRSVVGEALTVLERQDGRDRAGGRSGGGRPWRSPTSAGCGVRGARGRRRAGRAPAGADGRSGGGARLASRRTLVGRGRPAADRGRARRRG